MDLKIIETTSNSVQLSWLSGSNGGENATYVITIGNIFNLTTIVDDDDDVSSSTVDVPSSSSAWTDSGDTETKYNMIEIRGLQSNKAYDFKIMAFNSMGSSEYSPTVGTITQRTHLKANSLPALTNAQFNEQREAICFDLDSMASLFDKSSTTMQTSYKSLNELLIRIEIDLNDELLFANQTSDNVDDLFSADGEEMTYRQQQQQQQLQSLSPKNKKNLFDQFKQAQIWTKLHILFAINGCRSSASKFESKRRCWWFSGKKEAVK